MPLSLTQAELTARRVLQETGIERLPAFPLDELILSRGAFYRERPLANREAEIVTVAGQSIITINSLTRSRLRRRFAAAHELGHFELHRDLRPQFTDNLSSLIDWHRHGTQEQEANYFAAELLMPASMFAHKTHRRPFTPELLDEVRDHFDVSAAAALLKYLRCGSVPLFVAYCKDSRVQWTTQSPDFPCRCSLRNLPPRPLSVAAEILSGGAVYQGPARRQRVPSAAWFDSDWPEDDVNEWFLYSPAGQSGFAAVWYD